MKPVSRRVFDAIFACSLLALGTPTCAEEKPIDFIRDIRPLLSDRCFHCHGPDESHREADLRLDQEEAAKDYAIVPGQPGESEFVSRITSEDPDLHMPPPKSGKMLEDDEIKLLQRWIKEGAPWSAHWAYVPPVRHPVPKNKRTDWSVNWIDDFILARLDAEGLAPSPDADRVTLIRRLSFDLIGLPPTPAEVDAFVNSGDPNVYEKLVDRFLESPHYGERMAMYWLDLVRYADTVGYHGDQDHNISPYRDYVIDAFNDNLPFDRFTKEQLAGDLLPSANIDQLIATGYNRMLQTSHEGGVQPKEYLAIYAADRVRNVSAVWLGATLGCAQCHNHKFDPFTTKDFYSMSAFFADIDEAQHFKTGSNALPTRRPPEKEVLSKRERHRIAELDERIEALKQKLADLAKIEGESTKAERDQLAERIADAERERDEIRKNARLTMITVSIDPRPTRILPRGNWLDDSGPIVEPAVPEFLGTTAAEGRRATRRDLADWLTDVETGNGRLTARVFANRFWYQMFGVGIARVLDDLGGQGEPPVHPQLLDNLAVEFYENGWDIKQFLKLIAMSRTYRQSSLVSKTLQELDPYNRLYARQSRFRLPAEMIRDNALSISGLLVPDVGGPSVKPYQPAGYYRHLNFPKREYRHHNDERQWRRGLYVHWQRQFLHPMLKAFDAPSREECTAERPRSNTPLAALTLLNDPTFVESARALASRIMRAAESSEERLDFAFRVAVSRKPDDAERRILIALLDQSRSEFAASKRAEALAKTGSAALDTDFDVVDLAAWTSVARAILNLNETMTRN